ncbi:MAG: hypothetical protein ACIAQU_08730 [Phycisphaerales bacterium JB064]
MASRRPPLFELLQQNDGPHQGRGSGNGRPGVLGGAKDAAEKPGPTQDNGHSVGHANGNGRAEGSVETKPTPSDKKTTLEDLNEAPAKPKSEPKPVVRPEPAAKPQPKPQPEPEPSAKADEPAGAADWSGMHPTSAVKVRLMWVYGALVVVLAVVIGVWQLGYHLGGASQREKLEPYINSTDRSGPIQDPVVLGNQDRQQGEGSPLAGIERPQEQEAARTPDRTPVVEPEPVRPAPAPQVNVLADVREAGNNYLKLASGMTLERAKGLAEHLTANGVPAMALDEGRQGFGLYTAFPVPSGQYRAMGDQRRDLETRVLRLLGTVPQEAGGPYTPRDQLWMRFDG